MSRMGYCNLNLSEVGRKFHDEERGVRRELDDVLDRIDAACFVAPPIRAKM